MDCDNAILMATYNGEKYIKEQIESIQSQSETDWKLYIRDDGSTDGTVAIINNYQKKDGRILLLHDNFGNLGVKKCFMQLLKMVNAEYYFFSDQDDVWLPNKVKNTLKKLRNSSKRKPKLVHTNLTITDNKLNVLKRSFHPFLKSDRLNIMLTTNGVTGCTVAINDALKQIVCNDPADEMIMHDWWMGLCAVTLGDIDYINEPLILYRQHAGNQIGTDKNWISKAKKIFLYHEEKEKLDQSLIQAENLIKEHGISMDATDYQLIHAYATLAETDYRKRVTILKEKRIRKQSILGTCILWCMIIMHRQVK